MNQAEEQKVNWHKLGRPVTMKPEDRKALYYAFRVSQNERKLLDIVGDAHQWRDFCVLVAGYISYKREGKSLPPKMNSLEDMFRMAFIEGMGSELEPEEET